MNKNSAVIIALALMLTFGSFTLAPVPDARAVGGTFTSAPSYDARGVSRFTSGIFQIYVDNFPLVGGSYPDLTSDQVSGTMTMNGHTLVPNGGVLYATSGISSIYKLSPGYAPAPSSNDNTLSINVAWTGSQPGSWGWSGTVSVNAYGDLISVNTAAPALSVSIAGPATAAIGTPTSLGAVITGGTEPYEEQWTVFADRNGQDYTGTRSAANVNFLHTYLATSAYQVRVKVWDATGALAEATCTMNGQSQKPVMHGQLVLNGAAGQMLDFGMYTDTNSNPNGIVAWANCVPTNDYVVTWPDVTITAQYWYQLLTASAYPNPLLVTTRYTEANGQQWTYSFSFDTTSLTGPGTYINSAGDSGTLEEAPPTWLQGFLNGFKELLKEIFKWAFVPTDAQMEELMPGGSLGTALLDQTTWGTGSGEWNLTVHAGTIAIPLVDISFATIASWGFVTVIKTGIQAVMCVALVYMIVVLI